jgi:hypothetical protein
MTDSSAAPADRTSDGPTAAGPPAGIRPRPPGGLAPADLVATLASLQDQIDDLTAVAEAHQRRIADLERQQRQPRGR